MGNPQNIFPRRGYIKNVFYNFIYPLWGIEKNAE
jgi:hypothetical protein